MSRQRRQQLDELAARSALQQPNPGARLQSYFAQLIAIRSPFIGAAGLGIRLHSRSRPVCVAELEFFRPRMLGEFEPCRRRNRFLPVP